MTNSVRLRVNPTASKTRDPRLKSITVTARATQSNAQRLVLSYCTDYIQNKVLHDSRSQGSAKLGQLRLSSFHDVTSEEGENPHNRT